MSAVADEIALVETGGDVKEMEPVTVVAGKKKTKFVKKLNRNTVTYYQVLSIGAFVICVIIACVAFETYIHTFKLPTQPHHSAKDEKYHRHLVQMVNTPKSTWTAVYNPFASRSKEDEEEEENDESPEKMFLQMFADNREHMIQDTVTHATELIRLNMSIPAEYDVRKAYPQCWSVHQVYNQAGCGSCWAVAATSVMSDRVCISSNGSEQVQLSALDLTSCCHACGGCQGTHWSLSAFTYWKEEGLVSGGSFGTHEGCRPYSQEPDCGSPCTSTLYSKERTPKCERSCRPSYGIPYEEDKIYAQKAYWLRAAHGSGEFTPVKNILDQIAQDHYVELIQKEILLNGPVLGCFTLFEDFQHYLKGIYSTDDDRSEQLYGHCAKLLGWGSENGHKYWQYSNSWGRDWGEYGFFRISFDEVPEEVVAGLL